MAEESVMVVELPGQRFDESGLLADQVAAGEVGQGPWDAFSGVSAASMARRRRRELFLIP
ncbi:hypothetical protein ACFYWY_35635 [Streptomyces sp. NPDC002870]|uniref:hypothetical protein n=1 Tax=Streptomyces sp. NPDC002870 TaxID=3364666 RepID=UPI00367C8D4C